MLTLFSHSQSGQSVMVAVATGGGGTSGEMVGKLINWGL